MRFSWRGICARVFFGAGKHDNNAGRNVTANSMATPTPNAVNTPNSVTEVRYEPPKVRKPISVVMPARATGITTSLNAESKVAVFSAPV